MQLNLSTQHTKKKLVFLDTETTGLNYTRDRIIQLSCIKVDFLDYDGLWTRSFKTFDQLINPDIKISNDAFRVHGISNEMLKDKKSFREICNFFLDFVSDYTVVAHNAKFDINFLNNELRRIGYQEFKNSVIDSIDIARKLYPTQSVSLDALMKKFSIPNRSNHNALEDSIILAKVYALMINQSNDLLITENNQDKNTDFSKYQMFNKLIS